MKAGREVPKDFRDVVNACISQGWRYVPRGRSRHGKLIPPNPGGRIHQVASSPSDVKGLLLWKTQLRRDGADV